MEFILNLIEKGISKIRKIGYKNEVDFQYIQLCKKILKEGVYREGRNGGTYSIFGAQLRFDLSKGLPMLTTKKVLIKSVIHELIWFLKGDTSAKYLIDNKVKIWDLWIDKDGNLPFTYPHQWRKFSNTHGEPIDQIAKVINMLKTEPHSRRIIISAWNSSEVELASLPWCHTLYQFYVKDNKLSCQLYQRSGDLPLGIVFNWVSTSLLIHILAKICNLEVGEFIWTGGDVHIYENQVEALKTQFTRKSHKLPTVKISNDLIDIDKIKFEDISIIDYVSEDFIKIPVSK
jgi:thymidylate synthase